MRRLTAAAGAALVLVTGLWAGNWPAWRGPAGDGVSDETGLPVSWSEKRGIIWKCPVPGQGASTPVIWGEAIFLTSQDQDALLIHKIDRDTGRLIWSRQVGTGQPARMPLVKKTSAQRREQKFHRLHNMASPSAVTDGERVIVHFGSGILAAYDFEGRQLWLHDLQKENGAYTIWWGHANSPVLYGDLVIVACMQDSLADLSGPRSESYVAAYDKRTGGLRWKTPRMTQATAEECDAYTTPLVRQGTGGPELVVMGGNQIDGYDPPTGRQLWFLPGIVGGRTITGPTAAGSLVFATQGMRGLLLAIRPEGTGRLPATTVVWKQKEATPDTPCPVIAGDALFFVADNGMAQCVSAATGEKRWKERLPGDYKASPIAADGRIYFLNEAGLCTVVEAGSVFVKLAENKLDEPTIASPAVSGGRIYLRGQKNLYCIGR
jgi:outer membrane protein assembly factor BamB